LSQGGAVLLVIILFFAHSGVTAVNAATDTVETAGGRVEVGVLKTVVKVVSTFAPGVTATGTGFLVSREVVKGTISDRKVYLVTNKHVLSDWDVSDGTIEKYSHTIDVYFYRMNDLTPGALKPVNIQIADAAGKPNMAKLALHPNPAIDVAAVLLTDELTAANQIDLVSFDRSFFLSFSSCSNFAGVGDQVFALGYPLGITSLTNNLPIAKAGYIASVPGQEFKIDTPATNRAGKQVISRVQGKYLVVDGLIVPGNSGGPVVIPAETKVRINPQTKQFEHLTEPTKNYVVGMVSMGLVGSGLTIVVSSDYILELIDTLR
jgi:S1-C subfamily serine protease